MLAGMSLEVQALEPLNWLQTSDNLKRLASQGGALEFSLAGLCRDVRFMASEAVICEYCQTGLGSINSTGQPCGMEHVDKYQTLPGLAV
jgi:hypothetical protein